MLVGAKYKAHWGELNLKFICGLGEIVAIPWMPCFVNVCYLAAFRNSLNVSAYSQLQPHNVQTFI